MTKTNDTPQCEVGDELLCTNKIVLRTSEIISIETYEEGDDEDDEYFDEFED